MASLREEDKSLRDKIKLRLINLREKAGQNKANLSEEVLVDRQNFQSWEKLDASRGMTIYSIARVCKALNITLKEFFDDKIFNE